MTPPHAHLMIAAPGVRGLDPQISRSRGDLPNGAAAGFRAKSGPGSRHLADPAEPHPGPGTPAKPGPCPQLARVHGGPVP